MGMFRYQYDLELDFLKGAKLLYLSYSYFEKDWGSIPHAHYFTEILFITRGKGKFVNNNYIKPVKKNMLIIINPGTEHTEISSEKAPLEYVAFGLESMVLQQSYMQNCEIVDLSFQLAECISCVEMIADELKVRAHNYIAICQKLSETVLLLLTRKFIFSYQELHSRDINTECVRIRDYIDVSYSQNISLNDLAQITHISKYYLVHSFSKYFGIAPMNYLLHVRLRAGRELLESTNHSIAEIAGLIGFSSASYFTQIFKKHVGVSAREYRKRKEIL